MTTARSSRGKMRGKRSLSRRLLVQVDETDFSDRDFGAELWHDGPALDEWPGGHKREWEDAAGVCVQAGQDRAVGNHGEARRHELLALWGLVTDAHAEEGDVSNEERPVGR